jgi:threonine synthase
MELYNLKHPSQVVNFSQAVQLGLGQDRGLFFPTSIPVLADIDALLALPFAERSKKVLGAWLADELGQESVDKLVDKAFTFDVPLIKVDEKRACLELFHGPTLAFKDFGARFMAQCIDLLAGNKKLTILTATSGDTGAAVADAFYGLDNVNVMVLYPKGKISELQEKMFTTLGKNIHTVAVTSDFDACRLLAQICYYFEAVAQAKQAGYDEIVMAVPSGNFGNLTAGLFAKAMGLPIKRFIAATNSNDTVPRYLVGGEWQPHKTVATMSNAMDVSEPSNWPRVEAICAQMGWPLSLVSGLALSEDDTSAALAELYRLGYQSEPHAAIAAHALTLGLNGNEKGIFLGTAHPAKFKDVVDRELSINLPLPPELAAVVEKDILSAQLPADFEQLKAHMFAVLK